MKHFNAASESLTIFPRGGGRGGSGHGGGRDPAAGHGRSGGDWARGERREGERLPEAGGGEDEVAAGAGDRRRRHRGWRECDWGAEAARRGEADGSMEGQVCDGLMDGVGVDWEWGLGRILASGRRRRRRRDTD